MCANRPIKASAIPVARPAANGRVNQAAGALPAGYTSPIPCGACGALNVPSRRFCHSCGHRLWEPCYRCGTLNATMEKFCGACGANLFEWLQEQLAHLDEPLQKAQELAESYRFDEALALLRPIAALEDSRLAEFARRAAEAITQTSALRNACLAKVQAAEQTARDLMANHDYHQAAAQLRAIPPVLRTETTARLLEEAESALHEIACLGAEIRSAEQAALSAELFGKLARLLTLKPDHPDARRLAARFQARLVETAKAKLASCRYEEVVRFLERLPKPLQTEALRDLQDRALELAFLASRIRSAPVVTDALVAMARRLRNLAPHDREMAELCAKLEKARPVPADGRPQPPAPWISPPPTTALGYPVEWAYGLGRIGTAPGVDVSVLWTHPGRFAVACGLALQALDYADFDVNFAPEDEGLLERAARWLSHRPPHAAWGIDLGSSSLKAAKLVPAKGPDAPVRLEACDLVEYSKPLSQAPSEEQQRTLLEDAIRTFLDRNDVAAARVAIGLPPGMVLMRQLELPPMDPDKLDAAMEYQVRGLFPLEIKDLLWRYTVLDEIEASADGADKCHLAVWGVRRIPLKERLAKFRGLGLRVDIIQTDCLALHNFISYTSFPPAEDDQSVEAASEMPVAVLDVGADTTSFLVSGPGWAWLRTIGFGGDQVNKNLVRYFRITFAQAEQWKRNPAAAANTGRFFQAIQPLLAQFDEEVQSNLQAFEHAHPRRRLQRILGLGGGFQLEGLLGYLQRPRRSDA